MSVEPCSKYMLQHAWIQPTNFQPTSFQQTGGHLLERPILPFRYSVLLGSVGNWMLDLNTNLGAYVHQLITNIIPTIIISWDIDLNPKGILDQGLQFRKFFTTSDFFFRKKTHVYLEKSSIKFRIYLDPLMDVIGIGPLISECIIPNMHVARFAFPRLNLCLGCFPTTQPLQIPVVSLITESPSTIEFFCSWSKYLNFRWLSLSFQSLLTSFPWFSNAVGFASATKWENS